MLDLDMQDIYRQALSIADNDPPNSAGLVNSLAQWMGEIIAEVSTSLPSLRGWVAAISILGVTRTTRARSL